LDRTAAEKAFIDQYTRRLMVDWAFVCVGSGELPADQFSDEKAEHNPYVAHALAKGWITKRLPRRLTTTGWSTAASFLKR